jgi:hypothetical protein
MNIKITGVFSPSQKQTAAGIHGSVNLELVSTEGVTVTRLNGITVRQSKSGNKFLSPPAFRITGKDGEDRWLQHYNLFPLGDNDEVNASQKDSLKKLTEEILRMLATKDNSNRAEEKAPAAVSSKPSNDSEPWEV